MPIEEICGNCIWFYDVKQHLPKLRVGRCMQYQGIKKSERDTCERLVFIKKSAPPQQQNATTGEGRE